MVLWAIITTVKQKLGCYAALNTPGKPILHVPCPIKKLVSTTLATGF
jgi:hypothetical protein